MVACQCKHQDATVAVGQVREFLGAVAGLQQHANKPGALLFTQLV